MGSVVLHITHEAGGVDLVLADDEPVGRLLPDVLAAAGVAPNGALWRLAPPDGAPLRSDRTLNDAAMCSGGVLRLVADQPAGVAAPPPPPPADVAPMFPPENRTPLQRTRELLPPRCSARARAGLAAKALLRDRSRDTWHDSDYLRVLERRMVEPRLTRCATIAVVSPKGAVGTMTVTTLLGTLFAQLCHDRIVAIDTWAR